MDSTLKWPALLLLLGLVSLFVTASHGEDDFKHCEAAVKTWAYSSSLEEEVKEDKHNLKDLLFFLHIPRTGGRTYFHCFLRKLYSSKLECPRSYDKLRFDPRKQNCRLLVTHDDYSVISKLPQEKTSVVTILRNPVDRVFSSYEFSIEVAARFLVHPNLTSATQLSGRLRKKANSVSTLDIWPWKHLVPWMREDLFSRRDARMRKSLSNFESNDSYNIVEVAMPLHQYINHPIAMDLIHNGATFQVAGLTNNSYLPESHQVRYCVQKYHPLGKYVLEVAKKRLDHMLYVGLTEDHKESATTFADIVGAQVISQLVVTNSSSERLTDTGSEQSSSIKDLENGNEHHEGGQADQNLKKSSSPEIAEGNKKMTVKQLMGIYESCINNLRKTQSDRRIKSLAKIAPANFTKEARRMVPESVLQQIISLNSLDMELYNYAQDIFSRQHELVMKKLEPEQSVLLGAYGAPWNIISVAIAFVSLAFIAFLFVNASRRTSKIKV